MTAEQLNTTTTEASGVATVPMRFEVPALPVADVDRAKAFYQSLGWLVVDDIDVARDELIRRGVDVSEVWHLDPDEGPVPGADPERRSYFSRASFADPDGNQWQLQEVTERLPGRV